MKGNFYKALKLCCILSAVALMTSCGCWQDILYGPPPPPRHHHTPPPPRHMRWLVSDESISPTEQTSDYVVTDIVACLSESQV